MGRPTTAMSNADIANHPRFKLTWDDVAEIRRRREDGEKLLSIAWDYGISDVNVSLICRGKAWTKKTTTKEIE